MTSILRGNLHSWHVMLLLIPQMIEMLAHAQETCYQFCLRRACRVLR